MSYERLLLGCTTANKPQQHEHACRRHRRLGQGLVQQSDKRYYTGSKRRPGAAVLGVIDGTSVLIETVPQSSGSHSVAADSKCNLIFVPQVAPLAVVGSGGDTTDVGAGICGSTNGCVGVYIHDVDKN